MHLGSTEPAAAAESQTPSLLKGIAYCPNIASAKNFQNGPGYGGKEVRVFMGIDMRDANTGSLKFQDLRLNLYANLIFAKATGKGGSHEIGE